MQWLRNKLEKVRKEAATSSSQLTKRERDTCIPKRRPKQGTKKRRIRSRRKNADTRSTGSRKQEIPVADSHEDEFRFDAGDTEQVSGEECMVSVKDTKANTGNKKLCGKPCSGSNRKMVRVQSTSGSRSSNNYERADAEPERKLHISSRPSELPKRRKRKGAKRMGMVTTERWNCPMCTYLNKALETECAICEFDIRITLGA